jgi:hypothetical protein
LTQVFCDVTLCRWGNGYRRFEGTCRLHLQGSVSQRLFQMARNVRHQ